jgi:hypothetical protein
MTTEVGYDKERLGEPLYKVAAYRLALLKVWERAHKVQVGCASESFDIAIAEARQLLIDDGVINNVRGEAPGAHGQVGQSEPDGERATEGSQQTCNLS